MLYSLFIMRHGQAVFHAATDSERPLTQVGHAEVRNCVLQAMDELKSVSKVIHSPFVRAQQTAEIAATLLGKPLQCEDWLVPETSVERVINQLANLQTQHPEFTYLFVSHQPLVGSLLQQLCGQAGEACAMDTANLVKISTSILAVNCCDLDAVWRPPV